METIPFNRPYMTGRELDYIAQALASGHLAGDGPFTRACHDWLTTWSGAERALLTPSCTAALEMAALLTGIGPGDEVIMPSFTFVSTANAFAMRGATPVFVDIRPDTLNLDERQIEAAITPRTRAIVVVHYAGVGCEMDEILRIASSHGLMVVEDAAQGLMSRYRGRPLGALGDLGTLSFHETKNITCGEGGALLLRDQALCERAEHIRDKGTNRSSFFRGEIDKYTWVDRGSSFLPGELSAAFLAAQMEQAQAITERRLAIWHAYHRAFEHAEQEGLLRRPVVPAHCEHNGHLYYLLLPSLAARTRFIEHLKIGGIASVFHYVPLHSSPMGRQVGRAVGGLAHTVELSERLVRLPLWIGLEPHQPAVIARALQAVSLAVGGAGGPRPPQGRSCEVVPTR